MSDNTAVRNKTAWREWFWKNGFSLIIGTLVALLAFLSSWIFQTITQLQENQQKLIARLDNQSERDLKAMWAVLKRYEEEVNEHEIQIRLHDRLIGLRAAEELEITGMTYEDLMQAVRDVMEEDDDVYEYRLGEQIQQQMQEQYEDEPYREERRR